MSSSEPNIVQITFDTIFIFYAFSKEIRSFS